MAIYRTGQASMDAQGYITGYDTKWREQLTLIRPGATIFFIDAPFQAAVISEVISDTQIRAITTGGAEIGRSNYIILLHDSITVDGLAQDVAETLRYYQSKETQIEEAIEFFKNFDLKQLQDLANQVKGDAEKTANDRAATEQLKNDTQQIKGDVSSLKNEAISARDSAQQYMNGAQAANSAAETAKNGAVTARNEAEEFAKSLNAENLLHKDQNLNDLENKDLAREALKVDRFNQADGETFIQSPDKIKFLTVRNDYWGYWDTALQRFIPLPIYAGGTGSNSEAGARKNLNIPVGNMAVGLADKTDILSFFINNPESGYYSSGGDVVGLPEVGAWWMYNLHVHGKTSDESKLLYGLLSVTGHSGNKWENVCDNGNWRGWKRVFRSDNIIELTGEKGNTLGEYSIAIGDNDTGFKWGGDGILQVYCNGGSIASFSPQNIRFDGRLTIYPVDDNAIRVAGVRSGGGSAMIAGQIGGGSFAGWRDRGCGLLCEITGKDSAFNVFKVVHWGDDWIAGMDAISFSGGGAETHLYVKGGEFIFNSAGNATCSQWISTSDIRMKAQLTEIETASDKIDYLTGYTYYKRNNLIEDENSVYSIEAGLIAQDVERVLPEAVHSLNNDGGLDPKGESIKGINYNGVVALLVNAFKEQKAKVDKQQEEIETLKSEIADLKEAVAALLDKPTTLES
ncbi:tail fiber protein [Escherichia phage haarsle]|uniref:Stf n=1 Tax=Escherichia phage haarsle TaxID=2696402 RepID=A0A6B9WZD7_9CAUD|nr:tail fiber protein [Escherichia phage haarsle]QHR69644.1 Stf [Escherichia phage haarsle]